MRTNDISPNSDYVTEPSSRSDMFVHVCQKLLVMNRTLYVHQSSALSRVTAYHELIYGLDHNDVMSVV